ncbi:hypothetical protein HANVADRAFT_3188 [Hanseniaspora valbyensis NRRL Y-1626]|uniref:RING-type domain-containing protein n=1 Tax=Hanseniaspora valbyensis NRRL Y-1626 TaxID=766949 RepID=A0A1B7TBA4_9ASCO|nr:hypothetical protein HANVADRAFT_3188 [Hanseniaspora valbyensis NRRL Y-1626]
MSDNNSVYLQGRNGNNNGNTTNKLQENMMDLLNRDMAKKQLSSNSSSEMFGDSNSIATLDEIDRDIYPEDDNDNEPIIVLSDDDDQIEQNDGSGKKEALSYKYDVALKRKRSMDIARRALKKNKSISHRRYDYLVDVPEEVKVLKSGSWLNTKTGQLVSRKIYRETGTLTNHNDTDDSLQDLRLLKEVYVHDPKDDKFEKYKTDLLTKSSEKENTQVQTREEEEEEQNGEENLEEKDVDTAVQNAINTGYLNNQELIAPLDETPSVGKESVTKLDNGKYIITRSFEEENESSPDKNETFELTPKDNMYINLPSERQKEIQKMRLLKMDKVNKKKVLNKYIASNDQRVNDIANISRRATDSILLDQVDEQGVEHDLIQVRENGTLHIKQNDNSNNNTDTNNDSHNVEEIVLDALSEEEEKEEEFQGVEDNHDDNAEMDELNDDDLQITGVRVATVREDQLPRPIPANNTVMMETERRLREMAERMNAQRTNRMAQNVYVNPNRMNALQDVLTELEKYPLHIRTLFENSTSTKKFQEDLKKFLPKGASDKLGKLGKLYFKFRSMRGETKYDKLVQVAQPRGIRNHLEANEHLFMNRMLGEIAIMEDRAFDERARRTTQKRKGTLEKYMAKIEKLPFDQSCDFIDLPKKEHIEIVRKESAKNGCDDHGYIDDTYWSNNANIDNADGSESLSSSSSEQEEEDQEENLGFDGNGKNNTKTKSKLRTEKDSQFEIKKTIIPDEHSSFKKINVCFLCATPLRTGIPSNFKGSRHKDQSFNYLVKKYGVQCPYVFLTAPTETDRQYSKRVFIAIPCGHAYCGRCVMRISNSMKLPTKLKERRKNVIGCGNPYIYGPEKCVVKGCRGKFNKPNSFRELYL